MAKIGLFFGSFNPIHNGHLMVAQSILEYSDMDEVWFVVSPQSPFKKKSALAHEFDRIDMVELAIKDNDRFKACDVEFNMPKPSYTIDTLAYLQEKHKGHKFTLIIGEDNLAHFTKWKNHQEILEHFGVVVYNRPNSGMKDIGLKNVQKVEAPMINISATYIRKCIRQHKSIRYLVPDAVIQFIGDRKLYLS